MSKHIILALVFMFINAACATQKFYFKECSKPGDLWECEEQVK